MTEMARLTTTALLTLMKLKGVGRVKALRAMPTAMTETDSGSCLDALEDVMARAGFPPVGPTDLLEAWKMSERELERGRQTGVRAIPYHEAKYPARLRKMRAPPAVLFVKGSIEGLDARRSLAVAGTREPTPFGERVARRSGRTAAEMGFVVVSGLALGCATLAHEGCLRARGIGVAVLAHGLDMVYPAINGGLSERLLENGGCLVSEYPVGARPTRPAFVDRDRIQSGLSDGVLVIETDVNGGTMHTARFARNQDRKLACIEHPPDRSREKAGGNLKLIGDGVARPIRNREDLTDFLKSLKPEAVGESRMRTDRRANGMRRSFDFSGS